MLVDKFALGSDGSEGLRYIGVTLPNGGAVPPGRFQVLIPNAKLTPGQSAFLINQALTIPLGMRKPARAKDVSGVEAVCDVEFGDPPTRAGTWKVHGLVVTATGRTKLEEPGDDSFRGDPKDFLGDDLVPFSDETSAHR